MEVLAITTIGGVCVVLLGVIIKMQNAKVSAMTAKLDEKTDKAMCDQRYSELLSRLGRGVERFDKIDKALFEHNEEQVRQGKVLVKVLTIVERLNKNNGGKAEGV